MNNIQTSQFEFLFNQWPEIESSAKKVEQTALKDPRTACFYARRTTELIVDWIYEYDNTLPLPYEQTLSNKIHAPDFRDLVGQQLLRQFRLLKDLGNKAVHKVDPISKRSSVLATSELFYILKWFAFTYGENPEKIRQLRFNENLLPIGNELLENNKRQIAELAEKIIERDNKIKEEQERSDSYKTELKILQKQVAKIKKENKEKFVPEKDITEFETRKKYIDVYLEETDWKKYKDWTEEIEVKGMPNKTGLGYVDYVLWGDDGKPLGIIEAKKTTIDPKVGQQQAKLYADCLEKKYNQRPIIFLSNGFKHFIWDDLNYPRREVQGFYKKDELELLIRRRDIKKNLNNFKINKEITDRPYQQRAIRSITESLEKERRKALLVMATGTGKTRTIISLCDLLIKCNWIKRVLFLADRKNLVSQAEKAFKKHLPDCSPVNLVKNKSGEGRIFLSTYPTISNLIDNQFESGKRRFGIGHFDLVIIDEAHRSVYKKYYSIFEYFDSLLIGLTATPKDEIDRNTYGLFDLDIGMPTDEYSYAEAIKDNFLTPFKGLSIPLKFVREGIKYDELSEDEKEEWDEIEWETEEVPEQIYSGQINKILFNSDTVDKVLKHLWEYGQRGEDPDRIGKTIIFAKNQKHAEFIEERFDKNFPHLKGHTLRVISHAEKFSETLIEEFSDVNNPLDIGVSIDMLDTGLDIPEIVNLVFFKLVRSRTKFWQMIGRGTRLCPNLFGPGDEKKFFWIFDYCQNLEFFSMNNGNDNVNLQETISSKLFKSKVEILQELDRAGFKNINEKFISEEFNNLPKNNFELRAQFAGMLKAKVCSCNKNNFIVRPNLQDVEKFEKAESWYSLSQADKNTLDYRISNLPFTIEEDDPDAKRFDLLIYKIELAFLKQDPIFVSLKLQVMELAEQLLTRERVPQVLENLDFIREIRTQDWWEDINLIMLEQVRRKIRGLVNFIVRESKKPLFSNFRDTIGEGEIIDNKELIETDEFEEFREKTRNICERYQDNLTIQRLKKNKALTQEDFNQLEVFLIEQNIGDKKMFDEVKKREQSLGIFIRKLIGLDREATIKVFSEFLNDGIYSSKQIQFVNEIINYLTQHGVMDIGRIYEQPFNEISSPPEDLFQESDLDKICSLIKFVKERAEVPLAA